MSQERLPRQTLYAEVVKRGQLDNHEQVSLIILSILIGTVSDLIQAKCNLGWWIKKCGGTIWSCCSSKLQGKAVAE